MTQTEKLSVTQAAERMDQPTKFVRNLIAAGHLNPSAFHMGEPILRASTVDAYLKRFGGPDGLQAALREERRQEARERKAAVAAAKADMERLNRQASEEAIVRARETVWRIGRRENQQRREKFEALLKVDERAAYRFLADEKKKEKPKVSAEAVQQRVNEHRRNENRKNGATRRAALTSVASAKVAVADTGKAHWRGTGRNTTSLRGFVQLRMTARLIKAWAKCRDAGDTEGMTLANTHLTRLGLKQLS